jgi:hypothetical protein
MDSGWPLQQTEQVDVLGFICSAQLTFCLGLCLGLASLYQNGHILSAVITFRYDIGCFRNGYVRQHSGRS